MKKYWNLCKEKWKAFAAASFYEKADQLALLTFCLMIFDCSFSGGGHLIAVGSLTPRILLGFASLLFALPHLVRHIRSYLKNPVLWAFAAFLLWFAICAVRGYLSDQHRGVLISDIKGFMWLFLVPVAVSTIRTKARMNTVMNCILVGATIQAIIVLGLNLFCTFVPKGVAWVYQPTMDTLLGTINHATSKIFRIFMKSCPYMVMACAIAFYRQITAHKVQKRYVTVIVLCLTACLLSFTRSLFGCIAVVLVLCVAGFVIFYRKKIALMARFFISSLLCLIATIFLLEFICNAAYFNFAVYRTVGVMPPASVAVSLRGYAQNALTDLGVLSSDGKTDSTQEDQDEEDYQEAEKYYEATQDSDQLREITQSELWAIIRQNPVFGSGLGASSPTRDGPDEYVYLDLLARMGIVGLVLYMAPFLLTLWLCLKRKRKLQNYPEGIAVICGMAGLWAITWFNPWMNAVLGIAVYAIHSALPTVLDEECTARH